MSSLRLAAPVRIRERPVKPSAHLLLIAVVGVIACAPDESPPTAGPEVLREGVDMVIIDMEHYLTRLGVRRGRLLADTAEYMSENEIHLRPVELIFFDDEGREVSVLTADSGIFNEVSEDMEAMGNVVVLDRRDDGRLETEQIRYTKNEDRLYGDRRFMYESNGGRTVMRGDAFVSDPGLDRIETVLPEGSSEPRIDTLTAQPEEPPGEETTLDSLPEGIPDSLREAAGDSSAAATPDSSVAPGSTVADSAAAAQDTAAQDTTARDTTVVVPDSTVRDTTARDTTAHGADTAELMTGARRRDRFGPGVG